MAAIDFNCAAADVAKLVEGIVELQNIAARFEVAYLYLLGNRVQQLIRQTIKRGKLPHVLAYF